MFATYIYNPLYNALVYLVGVVPGHDVGVAIILLTLLVKIALFPMARRMSESQLRLKKVQPQLDEINKKFKDDPQQKTLKTLELYREHNIRPFYGLLVLIIQLPIIIGLYLVFYKGGMPEINTNILYKFVSPDVHPNMLFIGIIDMLGKSVPLAALVGITQFISMQIMMPSVHRAGDGDTPSLKDDIQRSMQIQMKYMLPVFMTVIAYTISSAVALYWLTSNIFTIVQELIIRRNNT